MLLTITVETAYGIDATLFATLDECMIMCGSDLVRVVTSGAIFIKYLKFFLEIIDLSHNFVS